MDRFLEETLSQPRILRATLARYVQDEALLRPVRRVMESRPDWALWTGMGTSLFAAYPASIYLSENGLPSIALETAELLHYGGGLVSERTLLIAVSQSGETAEVRKLVDALRDRGPIVGVTNEPESHVARSSHAVVPLLAGAELGPATKTYTTTLAVDLLLAMHLTSTMDGPRVGRLSAAVEAMEGLLARWEEAIDGLRAFLQGAESLVLLGRGPSLASAMAAALILKEGAKMRAEGISAGQFRHGPLEEVSPDFCAVVFAPQGRTRDLNLRLARDIARFGGRVVVVGPGDLPPAPGFYSLALPALDEFCAPLLEIVPFQLLAWRIAREKGLPPGRFDHMGKVTREE